MKPALTPEEWTRFDRGERIDVGDGLSSITNAYYKPGPEICLWDIDSSGYIGFSGVVRHRIAAMMLSGEPGGFTQVDVDMLICAMDKLGLQFRSLIERIEALLPPTQ